MRYLLQGRLGLLVCALLLAGCESPGPSPDVEPPAVGIPKVPVPRVPPPAPSVPKVPAPQPPEPSVPQPGIPAS